MNRRAFLAATAGTVVTITGCFGGPNRPLPDEPAGEWRQQANDSLNTGAAAVSVPDRGNPAWDAGEAGSIEPLVSDGTVFSVGASVTALDSQTGEGLWEHEVSEQTGPTPALTDDRLVVAAGRRLVAVRRDDGTEAWSTTLPRPAEGALTVEPPVLTVPLAARQGAMGLVAYDLASGDPLWEHPTLAARTAAIDGDSTYTTGYRQDGDTGILRALSRSNGTLLWEVELDHPDTEVVVTDEGLLVADEGTLAVHDPDTGARLRSLGTFGNRLDRPPAVADGVAYVGTRDGVIVALSIDDGSTLWRVEGSASRGISVGRETVVVSGESLPDADSAGLAALERSTGDVKWEHGIEGFDAFPSTAPVLADGAVFYTSNESSGVVALGDVPAEEGE